jgi:hypothetical protein
MQHTVDSCSSLSWQTLLDSISPSFLLVQTIKPFHNFEHSSHVFLSVTKLLTRIVNPIEAANMKASEHAALHESTFGITSDPLTQLAVVMTALVHDVDHPGVPNSVLVKEKSPLALQYDGKSVAGEYYHAFGPMNI